MSVKGDARSEAPSSGASGGARCLWLSQRQVGLGFAGFVWLHLSWQAFRAHQDGPLPEGGFELQPAVVGCVVLAIWVPFLVFAWHKLRRGLAPRMAGSEKARALAVLEQLTLGVVLIFALLHGLEIAYPVLSGALAPSDVRPELIAHLSSTQFGVPLLAAGYLCGVGAAAFFGTRQALGALGDSAPRALGRGIVALGVASYLLGGYAVIRCASGVILP